MQRWSFTVLIQGYGISTLFATEIYKTYGHRAIQTVSENPYRLAHDIYGIGFFSADRVALSMEFKKTGALRIEAGIQHVLSSIRDQGHCFLYESQIKPQEHELLQEEIRDTEIIRVLQTLLSTDQNGRKTKRN